MKKLLLAVVLSFIMIQSYAQDKASELVTDRPDMTESALSVPNGALQIEAGSFWEYQENDISRDKTFTIAGILLRYGLTDNTELRLASEYSQVDREGKPGINTLMPLKEPKGFHPLMAGLKTEILQESKTLPQIALLSHLSIRAFASPDFEGTGITPEMILSISKGFTKNFSAGLNFGSNWEKTQFPYPELYVSTVLGLGLGENLGTFLEYYMYFGEKHQSKPMMDAGFTYLLTPKLQLDASGGYYMYDETGYFGSFGISYRIPE